MGVLTLQPIIPADAEQGLRLSCLAGWNQTVDDWRYLIRSGSGWGYYRTDGRLVASAIASQWSGHSGWISMVLTDPDYRRRGLATSLMSEAIAWLESRGASPCLDATPAGEAVYGHLGFSGDILLSRYVLQAGLTQEQVLDAGYILEPIQAAEIGALSTLCQDRSGWLREALLAYLQQQGPGLAWKAVGSDQTPRGIIFGRPGSLATHLGPLIAEDVTIARELLQVAMASLPGPFLIDAFAHQKNWTGWLEGYGFIRERGFRRLIKGPRPLPKMEVLSRHFASAGPEMG